MLGALEAPSISCCGWEGELAFVQAPPLGYNLPVSATYTGR